MFKSIIGSNLNYFVYLCTWLSISIQEIWTFTQQWMWYWRFNRNWSDVMRIFHGFTYHLCSNWEGSLNNRFGRYISKCDSEE